MDNTTYNLITAQVKLFDNLTTVSNNIANLNTPGYKEDEMVFEKYLTKDVNDHNTMPLERATIINTKSGSLKQTSRLLDFAISGDAFFAIQTPLGIRYTRNGTFTLNNNFQLVNTDGYQVLNTNGDAIGFNQEDIDITVGPNGVIYARQTSQNPYDEKSALAIVAVANPKMLRKAGDGNFIVEGNTNVAQADPAIYKVMQGFIEESNTIAIKSMTNLVEIQQHSAETASITKNINSMNGNLYNILAKRE